MINRQEETILRIDESQLDDEIDTSARAVMFENPHSRPLNRDMLHSMAERMPSLRELIVGETSQIDSLNFLGACPQLRTLRLRNGKIKQLPCLPDGLEELAFDSAKMSGLDQLPHLKIKSLMLPVSSGNLGALMATKSLESLTITSWPNDDFRGLAMASVSALQVHGVKVVSTMGLALPNLQQAIFVQCRKLVNLADLNAGTIVIEGCAGVRLDTLASPKCQTLRCQTKNATSSMEFLERCPNLKELMIGQSTVAIQDVDSVLRAANLRRVSVRGFSKSDMLRISQALPHVAVSNVIDTLRNGRSVPTADFWN